MKHLLLTCLVLFLLVACGTVPVTHNAPSVSPVIHNALQVYGLFQSPSPLHWEREMARRYPTGAVLVTCHGLDDDAVWMCAPEAGPPRTVLGLVAEVRARFPDARIVLCICNPNRHRMPANITNVSYPLTNVWQFPDRVSGLRFDEGFGLDYAGDIYDFHEQ